MIAVSFGRWWAGLAHRSANVPPPAVFRSARPLKLSFLEKYSETMAWDSIARRQVADGKKL
jgi:hypothetical protein